MLGQPQYYTIWTKAVAYFATDGLTIRGRIAKLFTSDVKLIDCAIDQLPECDDFSKFSFDMTKKIKETGFENFTEIQNTLCQSTIEGEFVRYISPDEDIYLPNNAISFLKKSLGKNAEGVSKYELLYKFLKMTDTYLEADIRYGIPEYMIGIPRSSEKALLYIDDNVFPCAFGNVYTYYCNELLRYEFENEYTLISILYLNNKPCELAFGYKVLDTFAKMRFQKFLTLKKMMNAHSIKIYISNDKKIILGKKELSVIRNKEIEINYWMREMEKIQEIEEYYGISMKLKAIDTTEKSVEVYKNIDTIYSGIKLQPNYECQIYINEFDIDIEIDQPLLLSSDTNINVPDILIHEITFTPKRLYLMPMRIVKKEDDLVKFHYCIQYEPVS